jgi:hypothetical protein
LPLHSEVGAGIKSNKMKSKSLKEPKILIAYSKFVVALQIQNQGTCTTELVPYLTDQVGTDRLLRLVSSGSTTRLDLFKPITTGKEQLAIINYDKFCSTGLLFSFQNPNPGMPPFAICRRSRRAVILFQLGCENHVLVTSLKRAQANELVLSLAKGDLKDELTNLLGENHPFISQLQIYTDNHQFASVTAS